MWGIHYICDAAGQPTTKSFVRDPSRIRAFVDDLVPRLGMRAFGSPVIVHFAAHDPDAVGYSLVQLIETSSITGHFCDRSGDLYLDVFSCKPFDPHLVDLAIEQHFKPGRLKTRLIERDASAPEPGPQLSGKQHD